LNALTKYISIFKRLRIDRAHGLAPHKPILLISLIQAFQNNLITSQIIYITPELVALFKSNWSLLVTSSHDCHFSLPFYHLTSDKFWKLVPNPGFENILQYQASMRSFANLNAAVDYAVIEEDLFLLLKDKRTNNILLQILLDEYFPHTEYYFRNSNREQLDLFNEIESKILEDDAEEYRREIKSLIREKKEEEIFIRGSIFKREIPKIYNNTCCISGMKIDATFSVSMIDACHIIPFRESYDDTISNGIALCPNLHRAFDRGLLTINDQYKVVVSHLFNEVKNAYSIKKFENQQIILPAQIKYYPSLTNLIRHREIYFKP
jgi:putative restriction endonuclease